MSTYGGYVRVSSANQNEDRQMAAMKENGMPEENIFVDKRLGKDFERTQYKQLIKRLRGNNILQKKILYTTLL